jgi:phosphoribosylglycinamide formyltransferase-1
MATLNIAVLASGRGSNFKAIIDGAKIGEVDCNIRVLITDNPRAGAIEHAKANRIPVEIVNFKEFAAPEEGDLKIKEILDSYEVDLVVLAGYMRIIRAKELLDAYRYKIINIHPSLLPAFKGSTHAQKDAFEYGCKVSGLTIHFVTEDVDGGPIIFQKAVDISDCNSADEVAEKILREEHAAYKKVIDTFAKGRYIIEGRRTIYIRD